MRGSHKSLLTSVLFLVIFSGCKGLESESLPSSGRAPAEEDSSVPGDETGQDPGAPVNEQPAQPPTEEPPVTKKCPQELKDLFKSYAVQGLDSLMDGIATGDASVYYTISYLVHGMISGIEVTHDPEIEGWLAEAMRELMKAADERDQWPPYSNGMGIQLYTWQMQSAMARYVAYIKKDSPNRSTYDTLADEVAKFLYRSTFKLWYEDVYGKKIPYAETGQAFWNDKGTHFITMAISLYRALQEEPGYMIGGQRIDVSYFKSIGDRGIRLFKERLVERNSAWVWDEGNWTEYRKEGEENAPDTSHANREAMMWVLGYEAGFEITAGEMTFMGNTLGRIIWNGSVGSPLFTNYINGSNKIYREEGAWTNGTIYHGFAMTGRYSESALEAVSAILTEVKAGRGQLGRNAAIYGKVSLSGHQLRNICL